LIKVGIIGCGYWGPNHIRIFSQLSHSEPAICSDLSEERLNAMKRLYPNIKTTKNYKDILSSDVDAVCIASPTNTHFLITKEALEANKHVLCEKPLTLKPEESLILKDLAQKRKKVLMVGHIFLFNPGIIWMKKYIASGELGDIYSAYAIRTNLGPFRYDVNAMWDLAPHDISILNYLFDRSPINVSARGQKCLGNSMEDLAFATLEYSNNLLANIHVSWLDPKKIRQITVVGSKKMMVWDDLDNIGPIKVYDKHVEKTTTFYETYGEFQLLSREGSITIPQIGMGEPLKAQAQYFLNCIEKNEPPILADAQKGFDVVKTLCAIEESMKQNGACVKV